MLLSLHQQHARAAHALRMEGIIAHVL